MCQHTSSVVDFCFVIYGCLDALKKAFGDTIIEYWSSWVAQFFYTSVKDYCEFILNSLDTSFLPGSLPQLTAAGRSIVSLTSIESIISRPIKKNLSPIPNVRTIYRNVLEVDKRIANLCLRVGNLEVIHKELVKFKEEFLPAKSSLDEINVLIEETLVKVCDVIAFKLAYSDLAIVFENLYVGENTLIVGLQSLIEPFRVICKRIPEDYLPLALRSVFKALISAWMYYLLSFIPIHKVEELTLLPKVIQNDQEFFNSFFVSNDIENAGKGLTEDFMRQEAAVITIIQQRLRQSDQELISAYSNAENNKGYMKEIIVRILYGRNSIEANQFFKLHANIILK